MIETSVPVHRTKRSVLLQDLKARVLKYTSWKLLSLALLLCTSYAANAGDLYWVGNSGDWNDPAHWSTSSGGSGGAGTPGFKDNVHFDEQSFTGGNGNTIVLSSTVHIGDFDWTETDHVRLEGINGSSLNINGNFTMNRALVIQLQGQLAFTGKRSNLEIQTSDAQINSNVSFSGRGSWTLKSKLNVKSNLIELNEGTLDASNMSLIAKQFISTGNGDKVLDLTGTSLVVYEALNLGSGSNLTVNYDVNPILFIDAPVTGAQFNTGTVFFPEVDYISQSGGSRAMNICGTGAGETMFTIDATLVSDFNGFGVSCKDSMDGEVTVTTMGGSGNFTFDWIGGPNTATWTTAGGGTQLVIVTDITQNIQCATTVQVTDPATLNVLFTGFQQPTCNGDCDGQLTALAVGGTGTYDYVWNAGQMNEEIVPNATMLCTGTNTLMVTDLNGCTFDTIFSGVAPTPINPNISVMDVSCFGDTDGMATANPSGGNGGPFTYDWAHGPTTQTVTNLAPNTYSVTVFDVNGCSNDTTIVINEPDALVVQLVDSEDLLCNGICTGTITPTVVNGTPPYSFEWIDVATNMPAGATPNDSIGTGLCAAEFFVRVTDANGCTQNSTTLTLTEPPVLGGTTTSTDISCFGFCDGTATVNPFGGVGFYSVLWIDANGMAVGNGLTIGGLCNGTYVARITDGNMCVVNSDSVTITEPPVLDIQISGTNATCADTCDGTATIVISGGTSPYMTEWQTCADVSIMQTALTAIDLCADCYEAVVTDANGCIGTSPEQTITEPAPIQDSASIVNASCNGFCDGSISLTLTGGSPPYNVAWFMANGTPLPDVGPTAVNLCAGDYFAVITDQSACETTTSNYTVTEPTAIVITEVSTDITCGGFGDGAIDLTISGGNPGYTVTWFDCTTGFPTGDVGTNLSGLSAGCYRASVVDATGCSVVTPDITISEPAPLTIDATGSAVLCFGDCDGVATSITGGGTSPFNYEWFDNNGPTNIGQPTENAMGLCAGTYFVVVTDNNGCTTTSNLVDVTQPTELDPVLNIQQINCNGICDGQVNVVLTGGTSPYTYSWTSSGNTGPFETGLCAGNYSVTITDANLCDTTVDFTIIEPMALDFGLTLNSPTCGGGCDGSIVSAVTGGTSPYTYDWRDVMNNPIGNMPSITNLCAGTYTLNLTDANGCFGTETVTLLDPIAPTITVDNVTNAACGAVCNGTIDITVTGGNGPFTFLWSELGGAPIADPSLEDQVGLCSGSYTVQVMDANGCPFTETNISVTENPLLTVTVTANDPSCNGVCDATASALANGGQAPYLFAWSDGTNNFTGPNLTGLCPGNWSVVATDANGCSTAPEPFCD